MKFIIRRPRISRAYVTAAREWCDAFDGEAGTYMLWVCDYEGYAVVRIENPDQALAFRMRWL